MMCFNFVPTSADLDMQLNELEKYHFSIRCAARVALS